MTSMTRHDQPAQQGRRRLSAGSLLGGIGGAVLVSLCCLPGAGALAVGASAGTAASLFRLQDFQIFFQIAGIGVALGSSWWLIRRSRRACSAGDLERNRNRFPVLALGGFALAFLILNVLVIPWLERG